MDNKKIKAENRDKKMSYILWIDRILKSTKYVGYGRDSDVFRRSVLAEIDKHSENPSQIEILYYELKKIFVERVEKKEVCTAADVSFARLMMNIDEKRKEDRVYNLADTFFGLASSAKTQQVRSFAITALNTYFLQANDETIKHSLEELQLRRKSFPLSLFDEVDKSYIFLCNSLARSFVSGAYCADKEAGIKEAQNSFVVSYLFALACYDDEERHMKSSYFDFICQAFEDNKTLCTAFNDIAKNVTAYLKLTTDVDQLERFMHILETEIVHNQVHPMELNDLISMMTLSVHPYSQKAADSLKTYFVEYALYFPDQLETILEQGLEKAVTLINGCNWNQELFKTQEHYDLEALMVNLEGVLSTHSHDQEKLHLIVERFTDQISHVANASELKGMVGKLHKAIGIGGHNISKAKKPGTPKP